jgi:hypothetical protein
MNSKRGHWRSIVIIQRKPTRLKRRFSRRRLRHGNGVCTLPSRPKESIQGIGVRGAHVDSLTYQLMFPKQAWNRYSTWMRLQIIDPRPRQRKWGEGLRCNAFKIRRKRKPDEMIHEMNLVRIDAWFSGEKTMSLLTVRSQGEPKKPSVKLSVAKTRVTASTCETKYN